MMNMYFFSFFGWQLELLRNEGAITKDGKIVGAYFQEWKEK
jgi:hypothetical protein